MHRAYGPPLIQLAPMEGVLDWVLRGLLSEIGGVDRMVTEFVRVTDKLLPDHVFYKYAPELRESGGCTSSGVPVFVQLLGGQPGPMAENAARVVELGAPGVDLNFGCPAKTVNRHDGGAALLREPRRLYDVTRAVRAAVPLGVPVTAKVRLGFDHKNFHREIAAAVDEAGASHIVVHARTKTEMYTPPAHWSFIRSMREGRRLPFLANGEIWSVDDYHRCVSESGVSRVALGRGLVARPTLAREIRAVCNDSSVSLAFSDFDPIKFLREFHRRSVTFRGPHYGLVRLKQILRYWSRNQELYGRWFLMVRVIEKSEKVDEFFAFIEKEFAACQLKFKSTLGPTALTVSVPSNY